MIERWNSDKTPIVTAKKKEKSTGKESIKNRIQRKTKEQK